jgi:hypothetical protein
MDIHQQEFEQVSIAKLHEGAAIEMIDEALTEAWANIWDPNTEAKKKRAIHLTITLSPDEERDIVTVGMSVENRLAKCKAMVTRVNLSRLKGGQIVASELRSRQMSLPVAEESVDPETGEVIPLRKEM